MCNVYQHRCIYWLIGPEQINDSFFITTKNTNKREYPFTTFILMAV